MGEQRRSGGPLEGYRVLDLTDERGQACGALLAALGAEVILVEPPGGSSSRRVGPFAGDVEDPERSLFFWAHNRGKRSVTLDPDTDEGRRELLGLVAGADFLVESADPGAWAARGLGVEELSAANPGLIHLSITPFGSDGPKARWAATDLVVAAAGGQLSLTGDDDRPPVRVSLPQTFHHAAVEGAAAALVALHERERHSGRGQHIDLSAQQSFLHAAQSMVLAHPLNASVITRVAGGVKAGPFTLFLRWPCRDGFVSVTFLFGAAIGPFTRNLLQWVHEEGFCDEATRDKDWVEFGNNILAGKEPVTEYFRVADILTAFFATKTKAELLEASLARRLLVVPVATTADVLDSPQFADRGLWDDVDHGGDVGTVRYPGRVADFSATPLPDLAAAPAVGAHSAAVRAEPARARRAGAAASALGADPEGGALAGLKVLDLQWVMAGPAASRVLADYGATVVRVESANRIDTARTLMPFRDDGNGPDDSGLFNNMNAGKLGLTLDLSKPESRAVVHDLVRWADVVMESFSPRAMRGWGLHYDALREIKPDLVMASSCLMGQSGPLASLAGFGTMASAISGFFNITGWRDRPPCGPFGAYTDYTSPRVLAACVLAAVDHHRRTGEGQYIDLSQAEASMMFLAPALLEHTVNGRVWERNGNDDPALVPHGVYPAAGEDRWVAVACRDDADWARLAGLLGRPDLGALTAVERRARVEELDGLIAQWTATRPPEEAQETLQGAGVAAHQVQNTAECFADPQLAHRRHFREVSHATQRDGITWVEGTRFTLSRTPAQITRGGPTFGEHTFDVLTDILGYDGDRVADLAVAGVLE
jgi:crotonobetainyl-CoA:carnitine CoA-transferase CaiB-like acyl-CoA transferase